MKDVMVGTWAWGKGGNGSRMVFGTKQDENVLRESFSKCIELGFTKWDTAAVYGMGTCETLLGSLIGDEIYISTKFAPPKKYVEGDLTKSFEDSMQRLGRKKADLYWIHMPNNLLSNLKEAIPLIKEGRIGSIGISNVSMEHIKIAQELLSKEGLKLGAVQNHYSLLRRDQKAIIDYCNSQGITYYAYMVLEQGALAGYYNAKNHFPTISMRNFLFPAGKFRKIEGLLSEMKRIADKYGIDRSQVPILWAMGNGAVPIVGITKPSHAQKLADAMKAELTKEEIDLLTKEAEKTGIRQQGMWEPQ